MTQQEWDKKTGEKMRNGNYLWMDTWCMTLAAMIIEEDGSHLWTFNQFTGAFKDEKKS